MSNQQSITNQQSAISNQQSIRNQRAFTLIEILVVVGIIIIVSGLAAGIFSSLMRSYNKAQIVNELEQNGNFVLSVMEQQIRNAGDAEEITNGIEIEYRDGGSTAAKQFIFVPPDCANGQNGYIMQDDASNILTSTDPVTGVNVTSATFTVNQVNVDLAKSVDIALTLTEACEAPNRLDYQDQVDLRTTVVVRGGYE